MMCNMIYPEFGYLLEIPAPELKSTVVVDLAKERLARSIDVAKPDPSTYFPGKFLWLLWRRFELSDVLWLGSKQNYLVVKSIKRIYFNSLDPSPRYVYLPEVDADSAQDLECGYLRDKDHLYYQWQRLPWLSPNVQGHSERWFLLGEDFVLFNGKILEGVDRETFVVIAPNQWMDKNSPWWKAYMTTTDLWI